MKQISPALLQEWINTAHNFILIDIREAWERNIYNIGGIHITSGDIAGSINEIPKDKEVVLYCEKGIRSVIAIQRLEAMGFENLYNLSGGMKAWKEQVK